MRHNLHSKCLFVKKKTSTCVFVTVFVKICLLLTNRLVLCLVGLMLFFMTCLTNKNSGFELVIIKVTNFLGV